MLGRSFYDDPVSTWILPSPESRSRRLAAFFGAAARYHHLGGGGVEVSWQGTDLGAAALWDPPGRWRQSMLSQLRMLPALIRASGFDFASLGSVRTLEGLLNSAHPEEPHWYLAVVGSDPALRGRGFGQAVIQPRLDRCDDERCPAYLESSKFANIAYYQRFGFDVTGEISVPGGGPTLWQMWREPR